MKKVIIIGSIIFVLILGGVYIWGMAQVKIQPDNSIFKDTVVDMNWEDIKKAADTGAIVLFPIAVVEEHGPHMDLSPDIYQTCLGCRFLKQELAKKGIQALIAPPYYWGINESTGRFPGSFTVKAETFQAVISDTIGCLKSWGFTQVFCANLHGDPVHNQVLESTTQEIRNNLGIDVYNLQTLSITIPNGPTFPAPRPGKFTPDYHAGADETASMWAFYPERVNVKKAAQLKPQSSFYQPLGYVGDPASFKLEKGAAPNLKILAQYYALKIEAFLKQSKK
ncbi:MAG TPA: creatininase family protein [Bacillota bacterium]|nr:creatininase family protein [Bacillota bacterium]